jgi:membrane-associated phospholipid phosphatase
MTPVDIVTLVFTFLLFVLAVIFNGRVDWQMVIVNVAIVFVSIFTVNFIRSRSSSKGVRVLHAFYIMPIVFLVFKTVEKLSHSMHGHDFDEVLITADRLIFGVDPTRWLFANVHIPPVGIEFLQICYFSYYVMFIILSWELFLRRKHHEEGGAHDSELETYRFAIVYGFLLSYIGYLLLPSVGPRFTLHEFSLLSQELPGVWFTDILRDMINAGENLRSWMTSAQAASSVTRDVFPSGHTQMTLITIILSFRFRTTSRWVIFILGTGLIISTVVLRYHYVIDVIAGALFALLTLYSVPAVQGFFARVRDRLSRA